MKITILQCVVVVVSYSRAVRTLRTNETCDDALLHFLLFIITRYYLYNVCGDPKRMIRSAVSLALLLPGAQGSYEEWPGDQKVTVADEKDAFTDNISGVYYDAGESQENDVVLSVRNKPSTLYTLRYNSASSIWEEAESKSLHYANDPDGDPDSEDLTKTDGSSPNIYVCTERDNEENGSRLTVLLFRDEPGASSLTALQEWDLTSDIKPVEDNLGWEAITWVPDSYLVSHGLVDESRDGELYDPNNYPKHGSGLIFVGLEGNIAINISA